MTKGGGLWSAAGMANVLGEEKKQQVLALGRLNWSLRRIEEATGVRRETAGAYLKAAGVPVRPARTRRPPAKPASEVPTDLDGSAKPASEVPTDLDGSAKRTGDWGRVASDGREASTMSAGDRASIVGLNRAAPPGP